ncbi:MAG: type IV pili methyl-accepting chemotaxis transducer N-terminal domain-containing protein [Candidatus Thiodiazotropha sp.]
MKSSLSLRFGIVIIIFFTLAVSGMLSSVFIAETAEGYAAAINQAGTLRMQSYRITSSLVHDSEYVRQNSDNRTSNLVEEYNQRLFNPRIQTVIAKGPSREVLDSYLRVSNQWQQVIRPNLDNYLRHNAKARERRLEEPSATRDTADPALSDLFAGGDQPQAHQTPCPGAAAGSAGLRQSGTAERL